jgi:diadenosine tetraphosphatase ApaH/serine/threonine PP2A family protein phosphatase
MLFRLHRASTFTLALTFHCINSVFPPPPLYSTLEAFDKREKVLVVHGGLSPRVNLDDIARIQRFFEIPSHNSTKEADIIFNACLWADPSSSNGFSVDSKGRPKFGPDISREFCDDDSNRVRLIVRSHEMRTDGFCYVPNHGNRVVTIFSAANYCKGTNYGAVLTFDSDLKHSANLKWKDLPKLSDFKINDYSAATAVATSLPRPKPRSKSTRDLNDICHYLLLRMISHKDVRSSPTHNPYAHPTLISLPALVYASGSSSILFLARRC